MSDDRQEPPDGEHDDDRTRPLPPAAGRPEPTQPARSAAEPDKTARIPAEPSWSGRAEVRPSRPAEPAGEWYVEEQGGRRWWLPILWGVLALLLAGLLGGALWLGLSKRDDDRDDPGSTPSLPPASATSAAPTSASPTTAGPTSETPSETPSSPATTSTPDEVSVPPLAGLPQATAEGLLGRLGIAYRVVYRPSELPPGTVVGTEPGTGTPVSTDDEVLLIVSQARPSTGVSPTTAIPTSTSTP
ncbi:PASTA domain-containing protein [Micromonospora sp. DT201]|uniref:PASTA domain-containing protein n=1 Tax=Micromonospora sp. DT201 TaxID=3393442 RepID=UPI003CE9DBCF